MKIDNDLRLAINAAARTSGRTIHWKEEQKREQEAIAAFERGKGKKILTKARALHSELLRLDQEQTKVRDRLRSILNPVGLTAHERDEQSVFEFQGGINCDVSRQRFAASGGVLPEPCRRKWSADEVLTKLAAADAKDRDKILAEYGINWK